MSYHQPTPMASTHAVQSAILTIQFSHHCLALMRWIEPIIKAAMEMVQAHHGKSSSMNAYAMVGSRKACMHIILIMQSTPSWLCML